MIRDITLGQYFPGSSAIHRLDARVKITSIFVYIVALFIVGNFVGFAVCAGAIGVVIAISKVPLSFILRGLKPIFIILFLTFTLNFFMNGWERAIFLVIRLVLLIIGSSVLTLTTKPISLTDGIESLLKPLKVFKVPAHELAMMMSIALRFIPTLLEETDRIMKAQMARGADFESGNIFKRAKSLIPILVPLFISAFRIAQDLAMAMEARCYKGGEKRTRLYAMKIEKADVFAIVCTTAFLGVVVATGILL